MPQAFINDLKQKMLTYQPGRCAVRPLGESGELEALASNLARVTPAYAVKTAVAWHLCYTLLIHYGAVNQVDLSPVVDTLRSALHGWSGARGVSPDEVQVALNRLQQAGETAQYLSTIPD